MGRKCSETLSKDSTKLMAHTTPCRIRISSEFVTSTRRARGVRWTADAQANAYRCLRSCLEKCLKERLTEDLAPSLTRVPKILATDCSSLHTNNNPGWTTRQAPIILTEPVARQGVWEVSVSGFTVRKGPNSRSLLVSKLIGLRVRDTACRAVLAALIGFKRELVCVKVVSNVRTPKDRSHLISSNFQRRGKFFTKDRDSNRV